MPRTFKERSPHEGRAVHSRGQEPRRDRQRRGRPEGHRRYARDAKGEAGRRRTVEPRRPASAGDRPLGGGRGGRGVLPRGGFLRGGGEKRGGRKRRGSTQ